MTNSVTERLSAADWYYKRNGWVTESDRFWLSLRLGKDGNGPELLKEAIEKHKIELITQRLIHGSCQTVQTSDLFVASFRTQ